ncbi:HD-GYP domain-containing protein [Halobacillus seohaensis]|uniref:HD-GYP domain-containing protein n=1 Tax=Halobacillus seohaensis TaxID=447421 RepID=A0ABW2EU60_9BACI
MKVVYTAHLQQGDTLGKSIYNENGKVLLRQGVTFTKSLIRRLFDYQITYVYVDDPLTSDIQVNYPINEETRSKAIHTIKRSFLDLQKSNNNDQKILFERISLEMNQTVSTIVSELRGNHDTMSLLSDIFVYDDYVFTHSLNVAMYAIALANELDLPNRKVEEIGLGAILHDIGKMTIPRNILLKTSSLTAEEFTLIKTHAEAGFQLLRSVSSVPLVAAHCAYQHHERLDGSGYPRGITEKDIHLYGKILAIADVFDAVTSNRSYRSAMLPHEGLEVLYSGAGTLFDRNMVAAFRKCVTVYPNGLGVELSDGRKGIVSAQNENLSDRPIVRIDHYQSQDTQEVDLSKELSLTITDCLTTSVT